MSVKSRQKPGICRLEGCKRDTIVLPLQNNKKLKSRYCYRHTCEVGWGCLEPTRKSGTLYCKNHRTCAEKDCPVEGRDLHDCATPWYCQRHECPVPNCHKAAKPRHDHAPAAIPVPPPINIMKRCAGDDGCPKRPVDDSEFCEDHKCLIIDCLDAKEAPNGRCLAHQPCQAVGCPSFGRWNELTSRPERFCWGHEKCVMLSCQTVIGAGELHCEFHRCKLDGCKGEKYVWETKSDYCRVHTCGTTGCLKPIQGRQYPPPDVSSIFFRHCHEHTCNRSDCVEESVVKLGPCRAHSCSAPTCNHNVYDPHTYCNNHECHSEGCNDPSIPDTSVPYCLEKHACTWPHDDTPCKSPRYPNNSFQTLCSHHSICQAEMNGEERERLRQQQQQREAEEQARSDAAGTGTPAPQDRGPSPRSEEPRGRDERRRRRPEGRRDATWSGEEWSEEDFRPRYPPYSNWRG